VDAGLAHQHASVTHRVDDAPGNLGRGRARLAVMDQLGAEEQAGAPDLADTAMPVSQRPQQAERIGADIARIGDEVFVRQDIKDGIGDRAGNRIAAKGVELAEGVAERRQDL
jgi:hypothetical protein